MRAWSTWSNLILITSQKPLYKYCQLVFRTSSYKFLEDTTQFIAAAETLTGALQVPWAASYLCAFAHAVPSVFLPLCFLAYTKSAFKHSSNVAFLVKPSNCLPALHISAHIYAFTLLSAGSKMPIRIQAWCQARGYRGKLSVVPGPKELTVSGSRSPMINCNRIYRPHNLSVYTILGT